MRTKIKLIGLLTICFTAVILVGCKKTSEQQALNNLELKYVSGTALTKIDNNTYSLLESLVVPTIQDKYIVNWSSDNSAVLDYSHYKANYIIGFTKPIHDTTVILTASINSLSRSFKFYTDGSLIPIITFNYNGATGGDTLASYALPMGNTFSQIPSQTGLAVSGLPIPTKTENIFGGWYKESELINEVKGTNVFDWGRDNFTLYAKWSVVTYKINFSYDSATSGDNIPFVYLPRNANYGSIPVQTGLNESGLPVPLKTQKVFKGWYLEETFINKVTNESIFNPSDEQITLYAKWEDAPYLLEFDTVGGESLETQEVFKNQLPVQPANPIYNGYTFLGWYQEPEYTNIFNFTDYLTEDITIYAKWEIITYDINYLLNGGAFDVLDTIYLTYTVISPDLIQSFPSQDGKQFDGWLEQQYIPSGSYGNKTFTALWINEEDLLVNYSFDIEGSNTGFGSSFSTSATLGALDNRVALSPVNSIGISGFRNRISGASDSSVNSYFDGKFFILSGSKGAPAPAPAAITFAYLTLNFPTIVHKLEFKTIVWSQNDFNTIEHIYVQGWYANTWINIKDIKEEEYTAAQTSIISLDNLYFSTFRIYVDGIDSSTNTSNYGRICIDDIKGYGTEIILDVCTVTYYGENSSILETTNVIEGNTTYIPDSVLTNRDGYSFMGWYANSALTVPFDFATLIVTNTKIYAKWEVYNQDDSVSSTYTGNYYNSVQLNTANRQQLITQLNTLLNTGLVRKTYGDLRGILQVSDKIDYDFVTSIGQVTNPVEGHFYLVDLGNQYEIYEYYSGHFINQGQSQFSTQIVTSLPTSLDPKVTYLVKNGNNYDVFNKSTTAKYSIPYQEKPDFVWGIYDNAIILAGWPAYNATSFGGVNMSGVGSWSDSFNYSREHVWPNARLGMDRVGQNDKNQGSDIQNLRAIYQPINSTRSDKFYMEGATQSKVGYSVNSNAFYPGDAFKGDVARILFYMYLMYYNLGFDIIDDISALSSYGTYNMTYAKMGILKVMVRWAIEDPVDAFEIKRNEVLFGFQKNRNPLVDHPGLVTLLFGQPQPRATSKIRDTALAILNQGFSILNIVFESENKYN